jgi:hypothetical protein
VSRRRAKRFDVSLATPGQDNARELTRHDQLAGGAMRSTCIDDHRVGRGCEPQNRRRRAAALARSFGLGRQPTCTARSFAAEWSTVMARAGDNRRCKLQLHRRGTYLYWHTLSAVPLATSLAGAHEALPPELADSRVRAIL